MRTHSESNECAIDSRTDSSIPKRQVRFPKWMIAVGLAFIIACVFLLLTTAGPAVARDGVKLRDLQTSDLSLDGGSQLICFHTDDKLLAVVIAKPSAQWLSCDMHSSGTATQAYTHFNWDGVILDVKLNLVNVDEIRIGHAEFSLNNGRVLYWNGIDESTMQHRNLIELELRPNPDTPQKFTEPYLPLLKRINQEFTQSQVGEL
ncbi:MAG: hypothetical protein KDB22_29495 [Planctomycetales bacterium]|nr:hypothetical protein [Planctomycetales bacterium]